MEYLGPAISIQAERKILNLRADRYERPGLSGKLNEI
jgi:hypothetical protein